VPLNKRLLRVCPQYAKKWAHKLLGPKAEVARSLAGMAPLPVVTGLTDSRNVPFVRDGTDFLYVDHGYFCKDRAWDRIRIVRGAHHLNRVLPRPDDRLKKWDVQIDPWRRSGNSVVVIPPSPYYEPLKRLALVTDRKVLVKSNKGRFQQYLVENDAYAVVCSLSVAGVEAALLGYPVFSSPLCASYPISAGTLDDIDRPQYPERHSWACSLAYAMWGMDELDAIDWRDYNYQYKGANASSDDGQSGRV
jgi:hypothetical protein